MIPSKNCARCGHQWLARVEQPLKCPRCQGQMPWEGMHTLPSREAHRAAAAKAFDDAMENAKESR